MKYLLTINDDERLDSGDPGGLELVADEASELLRSGHFQVESITELGDVNG